MGFLKVNDVLTEITLIFIDKAIFINDESPNMQTLVLFNVSKKVSSLLFIIIISFK